MGRRLLVALLAACLASPTLALATHNDPKKRFTAADQATARSLLLKAGDLGLGWTRTPAESGSDADFHCPGYAPKQSHLTQTGEAQNAFANGRGDVLFAYASMMKSESEAVASWRLGNTPGAARCMALAFAEGVAQAGGKATITSYGRMSYPRFAPRVAAFRASLSITGPDIDGLIPFKLHVIMLGHGRADVMLMAAAPVNGVSQTNLRSIGAVLARRLAAAKV